MALARRERFDLPELFRRAWTDWDLPSFRDVEWMRVEEYVDDDELVIRAELPDIDPDKDVELSVSGGMLHIRAERHERTEHKDKGSYRSEFRYGSFLRTIPLPEGTVEADVHASYRDGVLEVRAPMETESKEPVVKVPISRG